jgi:uncharacterized protein (DUF433 family)
MQSWVGCDAVEHVSGRLSGAAVVRGTRVRPDDLLLNRAEGVEWLAENFGVTAETIQQVFEFYDSHRQDVLAPAS